MAKRETAASFSRRGMSQKQADALARGRVARAEKIKERLSDPDHANSLKAKEKWAMLLSGQMSVKDMDDEELKRCQFRNRDGLFGGGHRAVPSHIAAAISNERIRRARSILEKSLPAFVQVLVDIAEDPDAKEADRIKAAALGIDRIMGKAEQTVNIKGEDPWAALTTEALDVDRDLSGLAEASGDTPGAS